MASKPRRRFSKDLPPDLSELMNKLIKYATSFIRRFDYSEDRMRQVVGEFKKIAAEVRKMQEKTDKARTIGVVAGGIGLGVLVLAAPFTGGLSLLGAGAAGAAAGGATVVGANIVKTMTENGSAKEVEKQGKKFLEIVEPLKNELEEIKRTCERLEEESAAFQAENTLSDMEEFQRILRRVAELKQESQGAVDVAVLVMGLINDLLVLLVNVFRLTPTPEEDRKLTASILQSADQCQKVSDQFLQVKNELSSFTGQ
ncbi:uncharacterized protein LOC119914866 [Micropterus salmoides]|uniref:uncharacterized protein LOC119914866 n=1 Tax=Micropterus salmoides TaxID=27706 RepID=UPI0018EB8FF3|nr:uncharacterized protein LOC119914866 [Micropterus salmoides]